MTDTSPRATEYLPGNPSAQKDLADYLVDCGAVRFGEFVLKSGQISPVYLDMRVLPSSPDALDAASAALASVATTLSYDLLAGVPLAGLPLATALGLRLRQPVVFPRDEIKDHGTGKRVEGIFQEGQTALMIDDVISDGGAKIEAARQLQSAGLVVRDILVVVDRAMGGAETLRQQGLTVHAALTLPQLMDTLLTRGRVPRADVERTRTFLARFSG